MSEEAPAMTIDLKRFCGSDEYRPWIRQPWSRGGFTYATDGKLLVRLPGAVAPENPAAPDTSKLPFDRERTFRRVTLALPDKREFEECESCNGSGHQHDCPGCQCTCDWCDGSGLVDPELRVSAELNGFLLSLKYARRLATLPDLEVEIDPPAKEPVRFRFSGGDGFLSPMYEKSQDHFGPLPENPR